MRIFRWKAVIPLGLFVLLVVLCWTLFVDRLIRLGIEAGGTAAVGARVELKSARLHLFQASLVLRGLAVTNPREPMKNLFEVDELNLDIHLRALLEKKFVAETVAVRGLRFGTARTVSGALPAKKAAAAPGGGAAVQSEVDDWAHHVKLPSLDLQGLGKAVNVAGVSPESLHTIAQARAIAARGDSLQGSLGRRVAAADPRPVVDSAKALIARLGSTDLRRLGLAGARDAATSVRTTLGAVKASRDRLTALQRDATAQVDSLRQQVTALDRARADDYAYARRLVQVPSLDPKDISAALFGPAALERLVPTLLWTRLADRHLPTGAAPQKKAGPRRVRMAGTTFVFPMLHRYPSFLVEFAEGSFELGGGTTMAGQYLGRVTGVTTEPAVYGKPLTFLAGRSGAVSGPQRIEVSGSLDHTGAVPHDVVSADLAGVRLPAFDLAAASARMDLRTGAVNLALARTGDSLRGRWLVRSDSVGWTRLGDTAAASGGTPALGSRAWLDALVWHAVSSLKNVEVEASLSGRLASPSVDVSSNVGGQVATALRQAVSAELSKAEAQVKARVDSLVSQQVGAAKSKLAALDTGPLKSLTDDQGQLNAVEAQLQQKLRSLTGGIPGLRLP
ncbi:MAG TPA: hypothetical protein VMF70_14760 [Gemmatimonadales bacterium]|nr:hypothetical protein [Gemmatimonadales bacterium]